MEKGNGRDDLYIWEESVTDANVEKTSVKETNLFNLCVLDVGDYRQVKNFVRISNTEDQNIWLRECTFHR